VLHRRLLNWPRRKLRSPAEFFRVGDRLERPSLETLGDDRRPSRVPRRWARRSSGEPQATAGFRLAVAFGPAPDEPPRCSPGWNGGGGRAGWRTPSESPRRRCWRCGFVRLTPRPFACRIGTPKNRTAPRNAVFEVIPGRAMPGESMKRLGPTHFRTSPSPCSVFSSAPQWPPRSQKRCYRQSGEIRRAGRDVPTLATRPPLSELHEQASSDSIAPSFATKGQGRASLHGNRTILNGLAAPKFVNPGAHRTSRGLFVAGVPGRLGGTAPQWQQLR